MSPEDQPTATPSPHRRASTGRGHQHQMMLPNGRRLAYAEHGDKNGQPLLYFHGTPSSSVEWRLWPSGEPDRLRLRVITVDRPGIGGSAHQPGRRLVDWPADVAALADHLHLDRFAVLGYSGGCPYAVACAAALPDRVSSLGLVAVVGPFDQPGLTDAMTRRNLQFMQLCRDRPVLGRLALRLMGPLARLAPGRTVKQAVAALPQPDQEVLADRTLQRVFLDIIGDAQRAGARGPQHDMALIASPWHIDMTSINAPTTLWHGAQDKNATTAMARHLEGAIAGSSLQLYEHDGHLSIVTRNASAILGSLAAT